MRLRRSLSCREDAHVRAALQHGAGKHGARADDPFAVVENEQRVPGSQMIDGVGDRRSLRRSPNADCRRERSRRAVKIGRLAEIDKSHAVGILFDRLLGDLNSKACLADSRWSRQRNELGRGELRLDLLQCPFTPDQCGQRLRKPPAHSGFRTRRILVPLPLRSARSRSALGALPDLVVNGGGLRRRLGVQLLMGGANGDHDRRAWRPPRRRWRHAPALGDRRSRGKGRTR